ncbi:GntR family transcriptional regulator [Radiobacillus sp. PE A8.2]|uniref:GntR family transcriptional regulator n=1 Tax=Radiobacillus sp. PE A8.2 TaxID=3380349 RepID=UPI00388D4501
MLDKNSPLPIYYQLEEEIRSLIETGKLKTGDLLPSEREYSEQYGISRMTARQAINNLANEGLLIREKGKGTFVAEKKFAQSLKGITSFSEDVKARGLVPSSKIISFEEEPADPLVAEKLSIQTNDPIYKIYRIRLANKEPLALETTYTPKSIVGKLTELNFIDSFYSYIEQTLNLKITHGDQEIESALANESEIDLLKLQEGDPILLIRRTTFSMETPFEYVRTVYRADKYKYKIQMPR